MLKGNVDEAVALGALAARDVVKADFDEGVDEEAFLTSIEATYTLEGHTAGEGPIMFGLAHSDYSDAEIEEYIETTTSWQRGDLVAQEKTRRRIYIIGTFAGDAVTEKFNDGKPVKTKLKLPVISSARLSLWAYNLDANVLTTGSQVLANGHCWIAPR